MGKWGWGVSGGRKQWGDNSSSTTEPEVQPQGQLSLGWPPWSRGPVGRAVHVSLDTVTGTDSLAKPPRAKPKDGQFWRHGSSRGSRFVMLDKLMPRTTSVADEQSS